MNETFRNLFGDTYDDVYADKDYARECDLLEEIFRRFGAGGTRSIIDLGCGTGTHALALAKRGYEVTGVDRSPEMLSRAAAKSQDAGLTVEWHEGDVRTINLVRTYDAALFMFAVLSYQTTNEDVLAALGTAHAHLRPGGILAFDVWHGPGVLTDRPGKRRKSVRSRSADITRVADAELDVRHQLCKVDYDISVERGGSMKRQAETHLVRYFFPMELELFLAAARFQLLALSAFRDLDPFDLDREPDESDWDVLVIARAL